MSPVEPTSDDALLASAFRKILRSPSPSGRHYVHVIDDDEGPRVVLDSTWTDDDGITVEEVGAMRRAQADQRGDFALDHDTATRVVAVLLDRLRTLEPMAEASQSYAVLITRGLLERVSPADVDRASDILDPDDYALRAAIPAPAT